MAYYVYAGIAPEDGTDIGFAIMGLFSGVILMHMLLFLGVMVVGIVATVKLCCRKLAGKQQKPPSRPKRSKIAPIGLARRKGDMAPPLKSDRTSQQDTILNESDLPQ